jgi:putative CocE/NonD family hydrolase
MTSQSRVFPSGADWTPNQWREKLMHLPLITMDTDAAGSLGDNPLWNDYIRHSSFDDYWKALSMRDSNKYALVDVPVYIMGGWRDYYGGASLAAFNALKALGDSPDVRVRIGSEGHTGRPAIAESIKFLDYHLKGIDNGLPDEPAVKFAIQIGEAKEDVTWRQAAQWPPPDTHFKKFYLSSPDGTRSGSLQTEPGRDELPTAYTYDPADPVETIAANGSHIYPPVPGLISDRISDLSSLEGRDDVLVFATSPLNENTEIVGPVEACLWASSSARDTDFIVRLIDVTPQGKALNVTEGIVRARFRNSIWEQPSLINPGQIYEYTIELMPAAIVFRRGHRIGIHVQSSCWPLWDRNQNTGKPIGMDAEVIVARQKIYHDKDHPSRIILPIFSDGAIQSTGGN